jgi:hypothetical protein
MQGGVFLVTQSLLEKAITGERYTNDGIRLLKEEIERSNERITLA